MNVAELNEWARTAEPGAMVTYFTGITVVHIRSHPKPQTRVPVAQAAWDLYQKKFITLVRRRADHLGNFHYMAVKLAPVGRRYMRRAA